VINDQVDVNVLVEAESVKVADARAEEKAGIYFNGAYDCSCCGPRWSSAEWGYDGPTDEPMLYEQPISRKINAKIGDRYTFSTVRGAESTVHLYHADGTHERIFVKNGYVTGVDRK
jgi:hypothetical protein